MFELHAPASWACVEFISDLHLHPTQGATFKAWQAYMRSCQADALFILGDLFEVWVGDDAALGPGGVGAPDENAACGLPQSTNFTLQCMDILRETARSRPVYFLHGNRDFLLGERAATYTGVTLLPDPTCLCFDAGHSTPSNSSPLRVLLSHGDEWCLADTDYMKFRAEVRNPAWMTTFLTRPLSERTAIAQSMRTQSEAKKQAASSGDYADLDTPTVKAQLRLARAKTLLHGHTHRPAEHALGDAQQRIVLSDWDLEAPVPRQEVLQLRIDCAAQQPENALSFERRRPES
jgi:UDP-2,3-diacylglucosamine hydrolase